MRTCGQQAAAALHRTTFTATAVPIAVHGHINTQHAAVRLPRSPPVSPRHLDPTDPELVRQLRAFLLKASQRPPGVSDDLEQLLLCKLAVSPQQVEAFFNSSSLADACSSTGGVAEQQQLQELESGLDHLLQLFSPSELFHLLQQQPALLFAPLASWCEFFTAYGFSGSQIKNLVSQTRGEIMTKGTLVTAGGFGTLSASVVPATWCPSIAALITHNNSVCVYMYCTAAVQVWPN